MALVRKMMARGAVPVESEEDLPGRASMDVVEEGEAEGEAEGESGAMALLEQIGSAVDALAEAAPAWAEDVQALQDLVRSMKRKYAGPGAAQLRLPL